MSATNLQPDANANTAGVPPAPSEAHQRAGGANSLPAVTVRVVVGAEAAYACIRTATRSLDVRLNGGRSAIKDMRLSAKEIREQAEHAIERAELIERAALVLDQDPAKGMFRVA